MSVINDDSSSVVAQTSSDSLDFCVGFFIINCSIKFERDISKALLIALILYRPVRAMVVAILVFFPFQS